jgi:hypothetical protein
MRRNTIGLVLSLMLLLVQVGGVAAQTGTPPGQAPQAPALPVFALTSPPVSTNSALGLAARLEGLGGTTVVSDTTHAKTQRFVVGNRQTPSTFEQYGASGGFFAYDAALAFSETIKPALDPNSAKLMACQFLLRNELFPAETSASERSCQSGQTLPYLVTFGHRNTNDPNGAKGLIGVEVQVPLAIDIGATAPLTVPLAGPGGHLSLLFASTDPAGSGGLDAQVPGLAALAEPWYQRGRSLIGLFPTVSPQVANQAALRHVQAALPGATSAITLGTPTLTYYVGDFAVPQTALVPELLYGNATAAVDGQEVSVKAFTVPAVQGFLPDVAITAPAGGTKFTRGQVVHFTGSILGTTGPFTFTWSLEDGTPLGTGVTAGGAISLDTANLPVGSRGTTPASVLVRLLAMNAYGASSEAEVLLQPDVRFTFLPLLEKAPAALGPAAVASPTAPYRVGVEWVRNYNGTNPNLSATQPDADHFYSGLTSYGWTGGFRWTDNLAWERDWRDSSLGGIDSYEADAVDFAYFSGHGSPTRIYFGVSHDALSFSGANARFQHARWVGFSSCQTLRDDTISTWFNAFQGAHMLLGFESVMGDVDFGAQLSDNMKPYFFGLYQHSIREAWVMTAFEMNAGKPAYIYATGNGVNPVDNKLPAGGAAALPRPFPVSWYYWVWYY